MTAWNIRDTWTLSALVLLAFLIRWLFFTGYFGSDEVTYVGQALSIALGDWPISHYIGSIRYGMNIPVAMFMWILGPSEFSANMFPLLCSLGEIAIVFLFARQLWGMRAAVIAALLLTFTPIHVHYAGRIMADAPLAFFITLSFYAFWRAEKNFSNTWYVLAGIAAGLVFWIKEVVFIPFMLVFAIYALMTWEWRRGWLLFAGAIVGTLAANFLLFWWITGNPLHLVDVIQNNLQNPNLDPSRGRSPLYYFNYLYVAIHHTWLLGYLALAGLVMIARQHAVQRIRLRENGYVLLWAAGLLLVFSFFVVSGKQIRFIPKQTNYMLIFVAPLAMLGGYFISKLGNRLAWALAAAFVSIGIVLAALEQQVVHVFTANSKATFTFAQENPEIEIYASTNAVRTVPYAKVFSDSPETITPIKPLSELSAWLEDDGRRGEEVREHRAYVVIDPHTIGWGKRESTEMLRVSSCWITLDVLTPEITSAGSLFAHALSRAVGLFPDTFSEELGSRINKALHPTPATVYAIPYGCRDAA